jgi:hypothetical protein
MEGARMMPTHATAPATEPKAMLLSRPMRSDIHPPSTWKSSGKIEARVKYRPMESTSNPSCFRRIAKNG